MLMLRMIMKRRRKEEEDSRAREGQETKPRETESIIIGDRSAGWISVKGGKGI